MKKLLILSLVGNVVLTVIIIAIVLRKGADGLESNSVPKVIQSKVVASEIIPKVEFHLAEPESSPGLILAQSEDGANKIYIHPEVLLNNSDIDDVMMNMGKQFNSTGVHIKFTDQGAAKLKIITQENIGKRLAILSDGKLLIAPSIVSVIDGGMVEVSMINDAENVRAIFYGLRGR
jgi:preprotein translocase subunit SecD